MAYGLGIADKNGSILEIESLPYVYHAILYLENIGIGTRTYKIAPATHGRTLMIAPCMNTHYAWGGPALSAYNASPAPHKYRHNYGQSAARGIVIDSMTIDRYGNLKIITKSANSGGLAVTNKAIIEVWAGVYGG